MAEEAASGSGFSLSDTFKKVNHIRHWLMDLSMLGMVIGGLVATGGAIGFLDPVIAWLKMHVSGIPDLIISGPEFLGNAFDSANNGVFYTGADPAMTHATIDPLQDQGFLDSADRFNMPPGEYAEGWQFNHKG